MSYIAFVVNKVCQYTHASYDNHLSRVKSVLRYLKGTLYHGLLNCQKSNSNLQAHIDVHWQGNSSIDTFSDVDGQGTYMTIVSRGDLSSY